MAKKIIEGTILLIAVYLVVVNYTGFSQSVRASGDVYIGAVKALQGR